MRAALEIKNCKKTYKNGTPAINNISLSINEGDFFALLGPNGAGKTTLIGIIASLITPNSGSIKIFGEDLNTNPWFVKQKLGIMPQEVNFNIFQNSIQILENNAGLYGISAKEAKPEISKLLKRLNLWDKRYKTVRSLSGGYKRRLMLARALVHKPKLLLLDEPTAGVDVETRSETWDFIKEINENGTTVILTTHYLEEAESLCNQVAIINQGKMLQNSSMNELLQTLESESFILYLDKPIDIKPDLKNIDSKLLSATELEITIDKNVNISEAIILLAQQNITISSIKNKRNRLEELFIKLTQDNSR
ncbi:MAG: ABC transporter ATP-binding protein [Legionellales bacterium]|jgi:ABC-2 type transport system ATP-binding protein|nr:ABC transporter ATP-binding protein [Legionellales bacterium]